MLVLDRKPGEIIYIGSNDDIVIKILDVKAHPLRGVEVVIGIDAPKAMNIRRGELPREERDLDETQCNAI